MAASAFYEGLGIATDQLDETNLMFLDTDSDSSNYKSYVATVSSQNDGSENLEDFDEGTNYAAERTTFYGSK